MRVHWLERFSCCNKGWAMRQLRFVEEQIPTIHMILVKIVFRFL